MVHKNPMYFSYLFNTTKGTTVVWITMKAKLGLSSNSGKLV